MDKDFIWSAIQSSDQAFIKQILQMSSTDAITMLQNTWWQNINQLTTQEQKIYCLKLLQSVLIQALSNFQLMLDKELARLIIRICIDTISNATHPLIQQTSVEILCVQFIKSTCEDWRAQVFDQETVRFLFRGLSEPAINVPSLNQKSRFSVLTIYQEFTLKKDLFLDKVQHPAMFISGVLSGIYQEKDPRNLLISFDLLKFLLATFMKENYCSFDNELQEMQFAEDFFDSVSCYFPINFTPPKNDTIRVSPQTLKVLLADCFTASPKLLGHFVPFLIEKVGVKQVETKIESLDLLQKILETFQVKWLNEDLLRQILSVTSNMFFKDVSDAQLQPKAGKLIGNVLDKMLPQGVTFSLGVKSEILQFVNRCVEDIERQPDSMQAGLSSVLLNQICQASQKMQIVIATHVFLRLLNELSSEHLQLNHRVAYTSVLTGLLEKAGKSFCNLTTNDPFVVEKIKALIFNHLEINEGDASMQELWQKNQPLELVLYEKTLYLVQALFDPKLERHSDIDLLKPAVYQQCGQVLLQTASDIEDVKYKMCFATLVREAETEANLVSQSLRQLTSNEDVILGLYQNGLLRSENDVYLGFQNIWKNDIRYLQPLAHCKPSLSIDNLILEVFANEQITTLRYDHLKLLILKLSPSLTQEVKLKIAEVCNKQADVISGIKALKFFVKHKAQISLSIPAVSELLQRAGLCLYLAKLVGLIILRSSPQEAKNLSEITQLIFSQGSLQSKLVVCKSLIAIGCQSGYDELTQIIQRPNQELATYFQTICKELPSFVSKENGFKVNRLYTQRLYNVLRPILNEIKDTEIGVQLLIQTCTLVSAKVIPQDLTPLAVKAFTSDANLAVKRTCIQMFMRVITSDVPNDQKQTYIELFLPKILKLLDSSSIELVLLVECLTVVEKLAVGGFPSLILLPYASEVLRIAGDLKSYRKRVGRKFARGVINAWTQLK